MDKVYIPPKDYNIDIKELSTEYNETIDEWRKALETAYLDIEDESQMDVMELQRLKTERFNDLNKYNNKARSLYSKIYNSRINQEKIKAGKNVKIKGKHGDGKTAYKMYYSPTGGPVKKNRNKKVNTNKKKVEAK